MAFVIDDLIYIGVSAALSIGEAAIQSSAATAAANSQQQALKSQELENQYKILKSKTKEADIATQYLQRNEMVAVKRGEALNSPSFNAIQVATLQNAQRALQADTTFEKVNTLETEAESESIKQQRNAKIESSIFGAAASIAGSFETAKYLGAKERSPLYPGLSGGFA